jgi:uncharacterized protein YjiS (DUF1127 family)
MRRVEEPRAGRSTPKLICSAGSDLQIVAPRRGTRTRLAGRIAGMAQRLAAAVGAWRQRRRARQRLESWLTMDARTLADIGLRPADVQAMVYGSAGGAQLAERGGRWSPGAGEKAIDARRHAPQLRVIAGDDLDAAA